jgi:hypothetical protein
MTNFFAQLAARYRGDADVLRPRVPFRFEPAGPARTAAEFIQDADPPSRRPVPEPSSELPHPPLAADRRQPPAGPSGLGEPGTEDRSHDRPPDARARTLPVGITGPVSAGPAGRSFPAAGPARPPRAAHRRAPSPAGQPGPAGRAAGEHPGSPAAVARPAVRLHAIPAPPLAAAPAASAASHRPPLAAAPAASAASHRDVAREERGPRYAASTDDPPAVPEPQAGGVRHGLPASLRPVSPVKTGSIIAPAAPVPRRRGLSENHRRQGNVAAPGPGRDESITVQVTIGRVEVRAARPAPSERSPGRPPSGPSLDDYLRRRQGSAGGPR